MSLLASPEAFASLTARSRSLHGHRYVLPVAVWILESATVGVSPSAAMAGLGGRADRQRVIEALERLVDIGAAIELPRDDGQKNSPRYFERAESPFWRFVAEYVADLASSGDSPERLAGAISRRLGASG